MGKAIGWTLACAGAALAPPVLAQKRPVAAPIPVATDAPLAPASTRATIVLAGQRLRYRATWSETVLRDPAGVPDATISATSYVRTDVSDPATRPVVILFNGGPGASSSPLHFSAFGPRRLGPRDASGNRALLDNGETLLDVADLVFVDPVGTGFSRPLRPGGGQRYWSVEGDATAVLTLVRDWLRANRRTISPLFLAGESYGTYRLGTMARHLDGLNVAGLILVSPALDFGTAADQAAIDRLPTMALAAAVRRQPGDAATQWDAARRFAETDYAVALQQGTLLPAAERDRVQATVTRFTGASDLRPQTQPFLETVLPGHIVSRLDVRVAQPKAPPANADRPAAANDPSLGLGRSNVIVSAPITRYLTQDIGVRTSRDYVSLTLDVNFAWNWQRPDTEPGATWSVVPAIAQAMAARPGVRLLAIGGYYDLATPWLATRHALTRGDLPMDRVTLLPLASGHSPFEDEAERARGAASIRAFIAAAK
ncbi:carboxypeptidase C (cathepsin A) [Sphingomonas jinjuensis]|uniref:Carboxypeptidase C (Cathepsin A) n=1 Tax=Sphingomonas jinjuensis TaxID=535907 RepID=A0A840FNV6_9SPHN|nr:hypothetical protein [Sphingomonas jinjuensis]MBB4155568.1 carboxypeptidase C (cathepsin A) [Sphingomonas jinjuensis]